MLILQNTQDILYFMREPQHHPHLHGIIYLPHISVSRLRSTACELGAVLFTTVRLHGDFQLDLPSYLIKMSIKPPSVEWNIYQIPPILISVGTQPVLSTGTSDQGQISLRVSSPATISGADLRRKPPSVCCRLGT